MNPQIFREYDIRGVADRDLDDQLVRDLGAVFARKVGMTARPQDGRIAIAVGRDCRLHSPRLFNALADGLRTHADVIDLGEVATPQLYFAAHHLAPAGAVMITGSHNPAEDNGFKLMIGTSTLYGADIAELRDAIAALNDDGLTLPPPIGAVRTEDIVPAYLEHAVSQLRLGGRRCRVVVDAGNGSGGPGAVTLYRRLGFDVVPLHCDPDGRFPHHHPDPTVPANLEELRARVTTERAEVGIALDGDADRVGAIDGTGRILWGDQLMILLGKAVLAEVPHAAFVGEVKCSQAMFDELAKAGGTVEMWKVGHSLIKARMKQTGAQLAGEMSGHMFFAHRYLGFDDAIYAGARLLELISHSDRPLAALAAALPVMVNTPEIRVDCPDDKKAAVVARVTAAMRARPDVTGVIDIDGVRASFAGGWGLVRASNTQPALVIRCEASDAARLAEIRAIVEAEIETARERGLTVAIGVDLGGTNLRVAAFTADAATPAAAHRELVGDDRTPEAIVERVAAGIERVAGEAGASGGAAVGVGIAAMLCDRAGTVANSPHLGWRGVGFGRLLADRLGARFPLGVYNDVNAVTWGEYVAGSARGCRDVLAVFVGTGIGGGLIVDGALVEGATNAAGEIGHVKVAWGERALPCACGQRGCVEAYCGGDYVQRRIRAELAGGARSLTARLAGGAEHATPGHVDQAAAEGDDWALDLWAELAPLLAVALANAVAVLNPARLVLGGGMLGRTPLLRDMVLSAMTLATPVAHFDALTVVEAELADDAGLVGSADLARRGVSIIR